MSSDSLTHTTTDTPAGYQHRWRLAARADSRLRAPHFAVLDAFAEHWYGGKEAMRGVGVSVERIAYLTGLGSTAIRAARAELVRYGWLTVLRHHGQGTVSRYVFTTPDLSSVPARVIHKEAASRPAKDVRRPRGGHLPRPFPDLPTSRAHGADPDPSPTDEAGGQTTPTTTAPAGRPADHPKTGPDGTLAGWDAVVAVLPAPVAERARTGRTARLMAQLVAACLAAGWSVEQLRSRLADVENGARNPVSVAVTRLRDVQADRPPRPAAPQLSVAQLHRLAGGAECPHGDLDVVNPATNLHVCPSCRAAAKATETASPQVRTSKTALEGLASTWRLAE